MCAATATSTDLLAALAERQDPAAWAILVERHGTAMYRSAIAITSDPVRADDAVQESLLHLRQRAGRFRGAPPGVDPEDAVRHWLQRLAANAALHLLRAERRRQQRERQATRPAAPPEEPSMPTRCEPAQLSAALQLLSASDRQAILLRHVEGLDGPALAAALGCAAGAARVRLHRALERLRGHLARAGIVLTLAMLASRLDAAAAVWSQAPSASAAWAAALSTTRTPRLPFHLVNGTTSPMTIAAIAAAIPLLATTLVLAHLGAAEPPRSPAPAPAPVPAAAPVPAVAPAAQPSLQARLQKAVTVDFQDTALSDAVDMLRRLSGADIVIAPAAKRAVGDPALTLKVDGMAAAFVLGFIERLSGLGHRIEGERYILEPSR